MSVPEREGLRKKAGWMRTKIVHRLLLLFIATACVLGLAHQPTQAQQDVPARQKGIFSPEMAERLQDGYPDAYAPLAPASQEDRFGYRWDDTVAFDWIDATVGTLVMEGTSIKALDEEYSDLLPIGFVFPFYEKSYSQVAVAVNGILTFEAGSPSFTNLPMPRDTPPNNVVAAFWDDLVAREGGKIYSYATTSGGQKVFVIEWQNVTRYGQADLLTYEVILYENGDIRLQYQTLGGDVSQATAGIEDLDGIVGLTYVHNAPGLVSGKAILFTRPGDFGRVKTLPLYQSGFTFAGRAAFRIEIRNTGELGSDRYELDLPADQAGWQFAYYQADGVTPLTDTNANGKLDSGPVGQGESVFIVVRVNAMDTAQTADYLQGVVTATSILNASAVATSTLQTAIPASFVQGYADGQGMYAYFAWDDNAWVTRVANFFTGNTLSLIMDSQENYFYAWERNGNEGSKVFSDIQYNRITSLGVADRADVRMLTHNDALATTDLIVYARLPSLANAGNRVGVAWVQDKTDKITKKINSNIYLTAVMSDDQVYPFRNITNNFNSRGEGDLNIPLYYYPQLAGFPDGKLILAWMDSQAKLTGEQASIYFSVHGPDLAEIQPVTLLDTSVAGASLLEDLVITPLSGNRAIIVYTLRQTGAVTNYSLRYAVVNSAGQIVRPAGDLPGAVGYRPEVVQLSTGEILIAWADQESNGISLVYLDSASLQELAPPIDLPVVDQREYDFVSMAAKANGQAVLTWMDAGWKDSLYYALVDKNGWVTPTMIFLYGQGSNSQVQSSFTAQGVAPFDRLSLIFLPGVSR